MNEQAASLYDRRGDKVGGKDASRLDEALAKVKSLLGLIWSAGLRPGVFHSAELPSRVGRPALRGGQLLG